MDIYVGTQPESQYFASNKPKDVVLRLAKPIAGSNRNTTTDNWFRNIPMVEELCKIKLTLVGTMVEELCKIKLTLVGTLSNNQRELLSELVNVKDRPIESSIFAFKEKYSAVSYVPKNRNKDVLGITSMDFDDAIESARGEDRKPDIITLYNISKAEVDVVIEMYLAMVWEGLTLDRPLQHAYFIIKRVFSMLFTLVGELKRFFPEANRKAPQKGKFVTDNAKLKDWQD
ncbi:hypothetical protein ILUMI_04698 [Ignelater luminosus]|uniref:Uncharacterized protein n=1 Tax=Ignelater luminosus TaxID=2038154 RepID=A0A8K0DEA8_IGNLU|nr:hypothetical protein ILUMI_04698 [Ignelater luminosus]